MGLTTTPAAGMRRRDVPAETIECALEALRHLVQAREELALACDYVAAGTCGALRQLEQLRDHARRDAVQIAEVLRCL